MPTASCNLFIYCWVMNNLCTVLVCWYYAQSSGRMSKPLLMIASNIRILESVRQQYKKTHDLLSSQYSYELLLQFLHKSQSTTVLGIINEHINFQGTRFFFYRLCKNASFIFIWCVMYACVLVCSFSWTAQLNFWWCGGCYIDWQQPGCSQSD